MSSDASGVLCHMTRAWWPPEVGCIEGDCTCTSFRVSFSNSLSLRLLGSTVTPPFAPPKGMSMTAVFQVIRLAKLRQKCLVDGYPIRRDHRQRQPLPWLMPVSQVNLPAAPTLRLIGTRARRLVPDPSTPAHVVQVDLRVIP